MIKHLLVVLALGTLFGCASPDVDRSLVNDPQMLQGDSGNYLPISPFSGLKTRNRINGGNSCSTCAH